MRFSIVALTAMATLAMAQNNATNEDIGTNGKPSGGDDDKSAEKKYRWSLNNASIRTQKELGELIEPLLRYECLISGGG